MWRFHGADGGGRCFPAYEKIAAAARCARSTVALAIKALEVAGLLTWVNRITRIRRRERDLLGAMILGLAGDQDVQWLPAHRPALPAPQPKIL